MQVLFRGKVLNTDEYVVGSYVYSEEDCHLIYCKREAKHNLYTATSRYRHIEIDERTLSINFENMIDKNGKKIFASLSEDGVGGDVFYEQGYNHIIVMKNGSIRRIYERLSNSEDKDFYQFSNYSEVEVIGIYKGE